MRSEELEVGSRLGCLGGAGPGWVLGWVGYLGGGLPGGDLRGKVRSLGELAGYLQVGGAGILVGFAARLPG